MSKPIVINSADLGSIRMVELNGEYWFVTRDVYVAMGLSGACGRKQARTLDPKEKALVALGGKNNRIPMGVVNASGLQKLLAKTTSEKAQDMNQWLLGEVLPDLHKYGTKHNDLVMVKNDQVVVSSRQVAEHFGKEHYNVLRNIENILENASEVTNSKLSALEQMFALNYYVDAKGEKRREFIMNRDGFSLLVMGFTGKEALRWKLRYIQAFNDMEKQLKEGTESVTDAPKCVPSKSKNTLKEREIKLAEQNARRHDAELVLHLSEMFPDGPLKDVSRIFALAIVGQCSTIPTPKLLAAIKKQKR